MAKKKLAAYVHVTDPETNEVRVFGPDDDVPAHIAKLITNPAAWEGGEVEDDVPVPGPGQRAGDTGEDETSTTAKRSTAKRSTAKRSTATKSDGK